MNTENSTLSPLGSAGRHQMTEAAARAKMDQYIAECRGRAAGTLEKIRDVVPVDKIIPAKSLNFAASERGLVYCANVDKTPYAVAQTFHRNGLSQLTGRLNVPMAFVDHLLGAQQEVPAEEGAIPMPGVVAPSMRTDRWGRRLLAETLQELAAHSEDRYLVRSVDGEARAVLSDKYRRIDCRPGALALLEAAQAKKLVVSDGTFTETRSSLKVIRPEVIEVFPGEFMVFGFEWSNSDYGRGASDLRMFFWRCWCWNGATGESVVRQIHIGRRLSEDVEYARDTLEADAHASALALRDAAASAMSETKLGRLIEGIRAANETKIDPKNRVETLRKTLTKTETESVVEAFNSPDVENMPAGNTLWRLSNAISWVGGHTEDSDRRLDFERLAGDVMRPAMPPAEKSAAYYPPAPEKDNGAGG